jgi:hypothetical protein
MKLSDLKIVLRQYPHAYPRFVLPDGQRIPAHAHVTEVGHVSKTFIDCGGVTGKRETVVVQTHVMEDTDHRLDAGRFAKILDLGDRVVPSDRLDVEVEYDCCIVSRYPVAKTVVAGEHLDLILENQRTNCLARERRESEATCCAGANCC